MNAEAVPPPPRSKGMPTWLVIVLVLAIVGLLGVVAIGVLAALILPATARALQTAKVQSMKAQAAQVRQAIALYEADTGKCPPDGNANLVRALGSSGPKKISYYEFRDEQLSGGQWLDVWANPFVYRLRPSPGAGQRPYEFYSVGPNGRDEKGEGDDVGESD